MKKKKIIELKEKKKKKKKKETTTTNQAKFECKINIGSEIPAHASRQFRYGH
jgi:hypothetical protein